MKRNTENKLEDIPSCCAKPSDKAIDMPEQSSTEAFFSYMNAVSKPGAINMKNKKLMALALSVATRCEPCIKINTEAARKAGASDAEISEAVALGGAFGGAPSVMMYNSLIKKN